MWAIRVVHDAVLIRPRVGLRKGADGNQQGQKDDNRSCLHAVSIAVKSWLWVEHGRQSAARFTLLTLQAVIHVEFDRMGRHAQARDVIHLQVDVGVDQVITEHAARFQEVTIAVEGAKRLV